MKKKKKKQQREQLVTSDILAAHHKDGAKVQRLINKIVKIVHAHDPQHGSKGAVCGTVRLMVLATVINQLGIGEAFTRLPKHIQGVVISELIDMLSQFVSTSGGSTSSAPNSNSSAGTESTGPSSLSSTAANTAWPSYFLPPTDEKGN